jgi:hypothetical protein
MLFIGIPSDKTNRDRGTVRDVQGVPLHTFTSELIKEQKTKFQLLMRGAPGSSDDVIKNLFKVLCGIMNYRLKQRGIN